MDNSVGQIRKSDLVGGIKCPHCDIAGVVDYLDLVRGVSSLHCGKCSLDWKMQAPATMGYLAD